MTEPARVAYCPSSSHYLITVDGQVYAVRIRNSVPVLEAATDKQLRGFVSRYVLFGVSLLPDGCACEAEGP